MVFTFMINIKKSNRTVIRGMYICLGVGAALQGLNNLGEE